MKPLRDIIPLEEKKILRAVVAGVVMSGGIAGAKVVGDHATTMKRRADNVAHMKPQIHHDYKEWESDVNQQNSGRLKGLNPIRSIKPGIMSRNWRDASGRESKNVLDKTNHNISRKKGVLKIWQRKVGPTAGDMDKKIPKAPRNG